MKKKGDISHIRPPDSLSVMDLTRFFENGKVSIHGKNELICSILEGPCDYIHYIKYGYVKAYSETEGDNVHIIMDTNEIFPLLLLINAQDRNMKYAAVTKTKVYSVHVVDVLDKLMSDSKFASSILALTLRLYRIHADRVDNLEYRNARDRVIYRLLFLVARFGKENDDGSFSLESVFTHNLIGSTINLSRESVTREFIKLQEKGLIKKKPGETVIPDIQDLSNELSWTVNSTLWGLLEK